MYEYDEELIKKCLDLDEWKYSWHVELDDYKNIQKILIRKIRQRIKDVNLLFKGLVMATAAIAYEDDCKKDELNSILDEIKFLYNSYGLDQDENLTEDAKQLKYKVLELVDEIKRLYNLKLK